MGWSPFCLNQKTPGRCLVCPHGDSNSGFSLERAASWSTRRWGRVCGFLSGRILSSPPVMVKHFTGLFILLGALVEECQHVDLLAVEKDTRAFDPEVGEQDGGQRGIEHGDEVAGPV